MKQDSITSQFFEFAKEVWACVENALIRIIDERNREIATAEQQMADGKLIQGTYHSPYLYPYGKIEVQSLFINF